MVRPHGEGARDAQPSDATRVRDLETSDWKVILRRVRREVKHDNLSIVAAGVAFYAFLSVFPGLAALIAVWGLLADPAAVQEQLLSFGAVLPAEARTLLADQLTRLAGTADTTLGWGAVLGVLVALWSANKGMKALVAALNIAYGRSEKRNAIVLNLFTLALTLAALAAVLVALGLVIAAPGVLGALGLGGLGQLLVTTLRWPLLAALVLLGLAVLYRYAPCRATPRWRWVSPGSALATALWLLASGGFALYVARFGKYNETYGALGAVVILLMWLFVGAFVVLLGAEVNSEVEEQAA
jgi:membrane protein